METGGIGLDKRGFTLIELVVVLAILTIIGAVVLPELSQRLAQERFLSAVYQVHSDMRLAQQTAKREQYPVRISFYPLDKTQNAYMIYLLNTEHTLVKKVDLPPGVGVDYVQDSAVVFMEDGHAEHNGHLMLYQGKLRRFFYFYQTGRVRISAQKI